MRLNGNEKCNGDQQNTNVCIAVIFIGDVEKVFKKCVGLLLVGQV